MGYVREKYDKRYFLCKDDTGKPTAYGVEGINSFHQGSIRPIIPQLLQSIELKDKVIFSIGYGRGEEIKYALDRGCNQVIGIDFSEDAYHIAIEYIKKYYPNTNKVMFFCMDIFDYFKAKVIKPYIDVVFMFDVLEHIPRDEVVVIFKEIRPLLNPNAVIAVNMPFFTIDNDVVKEGVKSGVQDNSDYYKETQGMHCNRYTRESFKQFLLAVGYEPIEDNLFLCKKKD